MKKNVLLITDSYPPEIRSASHLMEELAGELKERGYNVIVATSYPRYNLSTDGKCLSYPKKVIDKNITIIRIKTLPHHRVNFIIRGLAQISLPFLFYNKIKKYLNKIDVVIIYSPPLPLAKLGSQIKKKFGAKFILNIQDIFPQNAIDLGVLKSKILIKYFTKMEKNIYNRADLITVHSEGNLEFIRERYPELQNKLFVLHNWIDVNAFDEYQFSGEYRKKYNLIDKFIILFAGVIGPSQGLNFIVDIAERVKDLQEICFLIVGDGMEKNKVIENVKSKNLINIIFKDFVSKKDYPKLVKDCDVGLVCLTSKNKTAVVPGKILGYMAAGLPVLAILNIESDGHYIIKEANCGYSCIWGDLNTAEELIRKMYREKNKNKELGMNGYRYVREKFEKRIIVNELEGFINSEL